MVGILGVNIAQLAVEGLVRVLDLVDGLKHDILLVVFVNLGLGVNRVVDLSKVGLDVCLPLVRTLSN